MGTRTAKHQAVIGQLGTTGFGLHAMYDSAGEGQPSIAFEFGSAYGTGLRACFHASTAEVRYLARHLVLFADAADKAQAEAQQVSA